MGTRRALFTSFGLGSAQKESTEVHIALLGELGVGKSVQKNYSVIWKQSGPNKPIILKIENYNLMLKLWQIISLSEDKALTVKYITRRFIMEYDPTLEDTYSKLEGLDNQEVSVKIMDTYDQEGANQDRYLKWAHGYIVVYSITNRGSFDRAKSYLDSITQYHKNNGRELPVALVGNKMDLERYRTVSRKSGESLASEHDTTFHETSAADDFESVAKVFHSLIRDILRDHQMSLQPLVISEDKTGFLGSASQASGGRTNLRRVKSPKASELTAVSSGKKEEKEQKQMGNRRPGVGLRLFKINHPPEKGVHRRRQI